MTKQPFSTPALRNAATPARIGARRRTSRVAVVAVIALTTMMAGIGATPTAVFAIPAVAAVPLGLASSFAVLTPAAVGNTDSLGTTLYGDLGAGGALTGFLPGVYTGSLLTGAAIDAPLADLTTAYANATGRPAGLPLAPDLLGVTVGPGVHTNGGAVANTGTFTIDAGGDPNAVFIFQIGGALAMAVASHVVLTGKAQAANVFWAVNGAGAVGANATFAGTLMATAAIAVGDGAVFNGRALSKAGAITMTSAQFYSVPPTVTIDEGPSAYTTDTSPTLTGTTSMRPPATITVTVNGETLHPVPDLNGTWSATPAALLANGTYSVSATVTDGAGNTGSYSQSLTIDVTPPVVSIIGGASRTTGDATPTISGTVTGATTGMPVTVTVAGQALATTIAMDLTWSVTAATITNGAQVVFVSVVDVAGNIGYANQSLTLNAVTPLVSIDGGPATATNDATPTISGASDAMTGSDVVVGVAGQTLHATVQPGGSWNVTASPIPNATVTLVATVTDLDGNVGSATQTLTINTAGLATISITGGPTHTTSDPTPAIAGTTDASNGRVVTITVGNQTMSAVVAGGSWLAIAAHLGDGTYPVIVVLSAVGGSPAAASQLLTIDTVTDTVPPSGPTADDFVAVGPKRVFDTRAGMSSNALRQVTKAAIGGPVELRVRLTDLPGLVPATGVSAVSLNVTATGSTAAGFITVYGCGTRELVSSLNYDAGATVANAVITPLSTSGDVCFYANTTTDVVADINGWFATGAAFNAIGPKRVFDTRIDASPDALRAVSKTHVAAAGVLEVKVTDLAGFVPATGISAVSLNVVVTNPASAGYVTVYPCGSRSLVSSVNYMAGATVASAVIAPVSPSGTVCFYSMASVDLVVDINGWLTAGSGFNPAGPDRVADTRAGESPDALRTVPKPSIGGSNILELKVTDIPGLVPSSGVSTVSLNVTALNPTGAGFITVFSCGALEEVSSLNFVAGQTVANAVLAPVSASGTICLYANLATDVVVDINGWIGHAQAT